MERLGVLMCVLGLGGASRDVVDQHLRTRGLERRSCSAAGWSSSAPGWCVFALSTRFAVFAAAALVIGTRAAPSFVLSETLLQESTEPRQRGRVFSARDFVMRLVFLIGVTTAGAVTRSFGVAAALLALAPRS